MILTIALKLTLEDEPYATVTTFDFLLFFNLAFRIFKATSNLSRSLMVFIAEQGFLFPLK